MVSDCDYIKIFNFIKEKTGLVIAESNEKMVKRFLDKKFLNIKINKYIECLESNADEFFDLIEVFTINETYFFREEKYYHLLSEVILPEYKDKKTYPPIIWSAASSSGQEPISLALLIKNIWGPVNGFKPVIATDIDIRTLGKLLTGKYNINSMRNDGKSFHNLLIENSTINDSTILISPDILNMISQKTINLIKDSYEAVVNYNPDIILICNVLIYMDLKTRTDIINKAVNILKPGGCLILSSSNTAFVEHKELELLNHKNCYYFRKTAGIKNS